MKKEKSDKNVVSENVNTTENKSENINDWKITKKDVILMVIISLIYAILSFINLGSNENPQTFWESSEFGDEVVFKIANGTTNISNIRYFTGAKFGEYDLSFSYDGENYSNPIKFSTDKVFAWKDYGIKGDFEYVKLVAKAERIYIGEIALYNDAGERVELEAVSENSKYIVDESDTVPEIISYLNSTYFDEVYFARTAYEHLHNLPIYEWTHPPLGKLLMTIPMIFMGMTPFAYRLTGNIAGILMIPAIYVLAKMIFKKSKYGVLAALIMALDGMHFVQTRMGTADGFLVLFIILEYLFMYRYILLENEKFKKRMWALFWSGFFMGCAIAVKWSGVFAAGGLAAVFFINLIRETAIKNKKWTPENTMTIIACFWFFVIVPVVIYVLSYIPYYIVQNAYIRDANTFIEWQKKMYSYHHDLVATHPYKSEWYTWPITQQSILYWVGTDANGAYTRIALLGNPAIWWFSIPCMAIIFIIAIIKLIKAIKNKNFDDKDLFRYAFLIIPILIMISAYIGVPRIMFLYHYFPILPFVMLTIVAFFKLICEKIKNDYLIYLFVAVIFIVFIMFYPVYSGFPTSIKYLQDLKWLKTWIW